MGENSLWGDVACRRERRTKKEENMTPTSGNGVRDALRVRVLCLDGLLERVARGAIGLRCWPLGKPDRANRSSYLQGNATSGC
jgi:hypothetical protein